MCPEVLARYVLTARCEGDKAASQRKHSPSHDLMRPPACYIASPNEEASGWDDFKIGAGFGAAVTGLTAAWAGSPLVPAMLGGAFGGGTMGYSYFQLSRFLEEKHHRSDAVTHAFAGSASGYLYSSILYGPKSIKTGAVCGGIVGLMVHFGAESLREWRHEASLRRRVANADRIVPPGVRELDRALDAGHITEKEHASCRAHLIRTDRSKEAAEKELAVLQAAKRARAQGSATLWPRWVPLQKMSDEDVREREEKLRLYHEAHLRMQAQSTATPASPAPQQH